MLWARFLSRLVQGFSRASLETRERIAPSFFSYETSKGTKRKEEKMSTTGASGARGGSHAFAFYGGKLLNGMGASWFVSYAYHLHVDSSHTKWNRVSTMSDRISKYNSTFSYHRYWLDKVMTMDDCKLAQNEIGLTAIKVKKMAKAVMAKNW